MGWVHKGQAFKLLQVVVIMGCAMLASIAACFAQVDGNHLSQVPITLSVVDMELPKVVQLLIRNSKQNIIINDQDELKNKKITANLSLPLDQVLRDVVESAGATLSQNAHGVYVVSARHESSASAQDQTHPAVAEPTEQHLQVVTIKIHNLRPEDMMALLTGRSPNFSINEGLGKRPPSQNISDVEFKWPLLANPSSNVIVNTPGGQTGTTPMMQDTTRQDSFGAGRTADATAEAQQFGGMGGGMGGMSGGMGGMSGGMGGMSGGMGGMSGGMGGGMSGRGGGGMTGGMSGGMNGQMGGRLVPTGITSMMPFSVDNSLIVQGTEEAISELRDVIKKLDIAPRQLLIKAELVTLSNNDAQSLGVRWEVNRLNTSFLTNWNPTGNVTLAFANGNVMANLAVALSNQRAKAVSSPTVATWNNVPNSITVGSEIPYWIPQSTVSNGVLVTQYSPSYIQVNTGLMVWPWINVADNSISMEVMAQVQSAGTVVTGPDGSTEPEIDDQEASALCRVHDGETFVIGGITTKNDTYSTTGIPFLQNLPIIGQLFTNQSKSNDDSQMLIFITPYIRPERQTAGSGIGVGGGAGAIGVGGIGLTP